MAMLLDAQRQHVEDVQRRVLNHSNNVQKTYKVIEKGGDPIRKFSYRLRAASVTAFRFGKPPAIFHATKVIATTFNSVVCFSQVIT